MNRRLDEELARIPRGEYHQNLLRAVYNMQRRSGLARSPLTPARASTFRSDSVYAQGESFVQGQLRPSVIRALAERALPGLGQETAGANYVNALYPDDPTYVAHQHNHEAQNTDQADSEECGENPLLDVGVS